MIVLDTHVLVWAMENHRFLGLKAAALIDEATASDGAYISGITCWEVSMLIDHGKLGFAQGALGWMQSVLALPGMFLVPVDLGIGADAGSLPGRLHGRLRWARTLSRNRASNKATGDSWLTVSSWRRGESKILVTGSGFRG